MTAQRHKRAMNLSIDRMLNEQEQEALDAHLDRTPDDAQLWERMKRADRMLRTAPTINAPANFAERLMAALASGRQPTSDPRLGLGIALGMLLVAVTAIPLFGMGLLFLAALLGNGAALGELISQLNMVLGSLTTFSTSLTGAAADYLRANPMALVLALMMLPVTAIWAWTLRAFAAHQGDVTYRIPVRVTAS